MLRIAYFISSSNFSHPYFVNALTGIGVDKNTVVFLSPNIGYFSFEEEDDLPLDSLPMLLHDDLDVLFSILLSHEIGPFEESLLPTCLSLFPNESTYLSELILKMTMYGNFSFYGPMLSLFSSIPHELMLTAKAYLVSGCNAIKASKILFIHRNTFSYRLNQFIELTNLDIRDYHNATFLELYFALSKQKYS